MFSTIDEVQKLGRGQMEGALESFAAVTRGMHAIAAEAADHSKSSLEAGTAAFERLLEARTLTSAAEIQRDYAKASFDGLVAYGRKVSELVADTAMQALKPYERAFRAE